MAGVSGWQDFLSCYKDHFEVVRANTPTLLDQAYRLRYQVYCVEKNYEDPHQADGRETDIYDERAIHALLMHRRTEAVAGTVRVILPRANDQEPTLPINIVADSEQRGLLRRLPHSRTAEISRFSVAKAFRQRCTEAEDRRMLRYITIGLIRGALEICRDKQIQYGCAVMERSLIRLLGRLGFVFEHIGGLIEYHGARQPCVAAVDQIASTAEGSFWWRHAG